MISLQLVVKDSAQDLNLVQELAREIWQEHYTPIIGNKQVQYMLDKYQSETAIAQQIAQGFVYYLLFAQGNPAGYLSYLQQPDNPGLHLSKLYVQQDYRGYGLGRAGLELVQEHCLQRGQELIWLTVNKYNLDSIAWYEHMGFEHVCSLVTDIGAGFVMDDYKMQKTLYPGSRAKY